MKPILVVGALGNVGTEIVANLMLMGQAVRATGVDAMAVTSRFGAAVEAVRFDFTDPTTFQPAFVGVERMFLMRPPAISEMRRYIFPAIDAAKRAGVRQIVFLSLIGVEKNKIVPHYKVEQHILRVGLDYTFLRPSFFMQNLSGTHRDEIRERDEILVPAGRGKTSFVDVRDIAAVAALALNRDDHINTIYELTGDTALSYDEVAAHLSAALGRPITYSAPSLLKFIRYQRLRGTVWPFVLVMAGIYTTARLGLAARVTGDVRRLLGRDPITFRQFAEDYKGCWQHSNRSVP
jgi:uncharacterized protein YbjT (DUF2867 family)